MTWYSDVPDRRTGQVLADAAMVVWTLAWIWLGVSVYRATMQLADPGRELATTGDQFSSAMTDASTGLGAIPLIAERVTEPFRKAATSGEHLAATGQGLTSAAESLAPLLGFVTAAIPIIMLGVFWLARRIAFARRAADTSRALDAGATDDVLALRAIASQPVSRLAAISENPSAAWRAGDPATIAALADLELADAGLSRSR